MTSSDYVDLCIAGGALVAAVVAGLVGSRAERPSRWFVFLLKVSLWVTPLAVAATVANEWYQWRALDRLQRSIIVRCKVLSHTHAPDGTENFEIADPMVMMMSQKFRLNDFRVDSVPITDAVGASIVAGCLAVGIRWPLVKHRRTRPGFSVIPLTAEPVRVDPV